MIGIGLATTLSGTQPGRSAASLEIAAPGDGTLVATIRGHHRVNGAKAVPGDGTIRYAVASSITPKFQVPGTGTLTVEV